MVETVIILPLLLVAVFFFIWVGISYHEKATLSSALSSAVRLAATRGDKYLMNSTSGIVQDLDSWLEAGSGGAVPSPRLSQLLSQSLTPAEDPSGWGESYYHSPTGALRAFQVPSGGKLYNMPAIYTYTLLYINQSLRNSLGGSVRIPCDPTDPSLGAGCVGCYFLNPNTFDQTPWTETPPSNKIAVQCDYRPANFIIGPLSGFLGIVSGSGNTRTSLVFSEKRLFMFRNGSVPQE